VFLAPAGRARQCGEPPGLERLVLASPRFGAIIMPVNPGVVEWLAIGLAFVAVIVILRYASRPRCVLCARRHEVPSRTVKQPWSVDLPPEVEWTTISWRADHFGVLPRQPRDANA
jgi:hypothetical protein